MTTYNTGNPLGSAAAKDLYDNSQNLDHLSNDIANEQWTDRLGNKRLTWHGIEKMSKDSMASFGYVTLKSFQLGAPLPNNELTLPNQVLQDETNGEYYRWDGTFPKTVPSGSTPDSTGGIGAGKWLGVGDSTLRSELATPEGAGMIGLDGTPLNKYLKFDKFDYLSSQMASGRVVKIACYGDSTTDGDGTTPYTSNPTDSSGNAVGNSDHNIDAPNAWPAQLQMILRDMYNNENIYVYNAGYSGKRMDNGWAYSNYPRAITNNPYYGICDAVIIDFGLNDITAGIGVIDNHISETEKLIDLLLSQGVIPVLLTSGPAFVDNDAGQSRDNEQISQQINVAKSAISEKYGIRVIDKALALKNYMSKNTDGITWAGSQPDGLHFGNAGHLAQAAYIATCFYKDTVILDDGSVENISFMDSRANSPGAPNAMYLTPASKFGASALLYSPYPQNNLGKSVIRIWLYSNASAAGIAYMAQDADNQSVYSKSLCSRIKVRSYPVGEVFNAVPTNVGPSIKESSTLRFTDVPLMICPLSYGLNLVEYTLPTSSSVFTENNFYFGWFKFADGMPIGKRNTISYDLLSETGPLMHRHVGNGGANYIISRGTSERLSNWVCFPPLSGLYSTLALYIDLDMSPGFGFMLMGGNKGIQQSTPYYISEGVMLVRTGASSLALYGAGKYSDNSVNYSGTYVSGTIPGGSLTKLYIELVISATTGSRKIDVYDSLEKSNLILTYTINAGEAQRFASGGAFGDVFVNTSFFPEGASGSINIKSAIAQFK